MNINDTNKTIANRLRKQASFIALSWSQEDREELIVPNMKSNAFLSVGVKN